MAGAALLDDDEIVTKSSSIDSVRCRPAVEPVREKKKTMKKKKKIYLQAVIVEAVNVGRVLKVLIQRDVLQKAARQPVAPERDGRSA